MKKHKKDILFLFICSLPVTGMMIYWLIWEKEYRSLPWAFLPQAVMALCIGIMILQEKHVLKRESRLIAPKRSKQWHSELERYEHENSGYRNIRCDAMSKDLKLIYRTRIFPVVSLLGVLSAAFLAFFYYYEKSSKTSEYISSPSFFEKTILILIALFGIACISTAIYEFLGLPVLLFIRKHRENADAIERSYMEGKMICGKLGGINVGFEYCIYYDLFSVDCFSVRNTEYAEVIIKVKKKQDRAGFYHKVKRDISIKLTVRGEKYPYNIDVNEAQLEHICGELMRRGVMIIKK
jgi:hypothetical protein